MEKKNPNKNYWSLISKEENASLLNRIFHTIEEKQAKKRKLKYTFFAAACILISLGITFYIKDSKNTAPNITDFVNDTNKIEQPESDEVVLTLGTGNNFEISEKVASINYSNTGQNVKIGNLKTIQQNIDNNHNSIFNTLWVPFGKRSKIELSDGTIVWLNAGSKMVYPAVFNTDNREVYLEGEAIFDVAHNKQKPFRVISNNQIIEVLGTVFCVSSYSDENDVNTILKSGSVQISYQNASNNSKEFSDKMKIYPGTKASYNKITKSIVSEEVNADDYFSWRNGFITFRSNDLPSIMKKLSRYYNIKIHINNDILLQETFSGYLNLNGDIDNVLRTIRESTDMDYKITENEILIN